MNNTEKASYWYFTITAIGMASVYIITNYSLWLDELSAVAAISLPVKKYINFLIYDPHPPLYLLTLKIWSFIFGMSERAVRLLSYVSVLASLLIIIKYAKKHLSPTAFSSVTVFYTSSWLFVFFAQEARGYSLMLLFSALATVFYLRTLDESSDNRDFTAYCLALFTLSLTHYFGIMYAGILILISIFQNRKSIKALWLILTGASSLLWVFFQFLYGALTAHTGKSWVTVNGYQDSVFILTQTFFPQIKTFLVPIFSNRLPALQYIIAYSAIAITAILYIFFFKYETKETKRKALSLLTILTCFEIIVILIDYHIPLSFPRHFIVLLPAISILFGIIINSIRNNGFRYAFAITLFLGFSSQYNSLSEVKRKAAPYENYISAASFMQREEFNSYNKYYHVENSFQPEFKKGRASYYLNKNTTISPVNIIEITKASQPFCILFLHPRTPYNEIMEKYRKEGITINIYQPEQSSNYGTYVIYSLRKTD